MNQDNDSPAFTSAEREEFLRHYLVAALWSSTDEAGNPLDAKYGIEDIEPETLEAMRSDCNDFMDTNAALLRAGGQCIEQMGHDFWLTRNGHGAGFWDRGLGKTGELLTQAAKAHGGCDLYVTDDSKIASMGA